MFRRYEWRLVIRLLLLFIVMFAATWLLLKEYYLYAAFLTPLLAYQFYDLFLLLKKAQDEVKDFAESVHYRDFSRFFNVKKAPAELQHYLALLQALRKAARPVPPADLQQLQQLAAQDEPG